MSTYLGVLLKLKANDPTWWESRRCYSRRTRGRTEPSETSLPLFLCPRPCTSSICKQQESKRRWHHLMCRITCVCGNKSPASKAPALTPSNYGAVGVTKTDEKHCWRLHQLHHCLVLTALVLGWTGAWGDWCLVLAGAHLPLIVCATKGPSSRTPASFIMTHCLICQIPSFNCFINFIIWFLLLFTFSWEQALILWHLTLYQPRWKNYSAVFTCISECRWMWTITSVITFTI